MAASREIVLDSGPGPLEDDLRLPRSPGAIRRFWARHPLLTDVLIAIAAGLLTLPSAIISTPDTPGVEWVLPSLVLGLATCAALVWRRRWPGAVFALSILPSLIFVWPTFPAGFSFASVIALASIAIYRSTRACWIALGIASALLATMTLIRALAANLSGFTYTSAIVPAIFLLLLGALVGINLGNRRRYVSALIDRSRQLLLERDQQARLAAAAERTRIAREMHDVVSHSLTVIVALSEGAAVSLDAERSREASKAAAATARDALSEMRVMLGVLREEGADRQAPLAPLWDASLNETADAARSAGYPVTLTVTGPALEVAAGDAAPRLAVLRVVQEGLTNAMRYARDPRFIRVVVHVGADAIEVSVENDGANSAGLPGDGASRGSGFGLPGLRERVQHLGGTVEAGMISPNVWRLHAHVPTVRDRE